MMTLLRRSIRSVLGKQAELILPAALVNKTAATPILSSIPEHRDPRCRLDSQYVIFPKNIMLERNRHRTFSLSDRSSRAVPPEKLIIEIRTGHGLAMPAQFRERIKGMGGGRVFEGEELYLAQLDWVIDALVACDAAEQALARDEAKETVNRRLDPYIYAHSLQTSTRDGWLNFEGLRLDEGADSSIRLLAHKCYDAYKAAKVQVLKHGQWHLPFVDHDEFFQDSQPRGVPIRARSDLTCLDIAKQMSAARCAHLSFQDLETGMRMTVDRGQLIYDKLLKSRPIHPSPSEHQATPDYQAIPEDDGSLDYTGWAHPELQGNLYGWIQARKQLPDEAIAPLPAGYEM